MRFLFLILLLAQGLAAEPNAFQQARAAAEQHYQLALSGDRSAWGATFAREHGSDLSALWIQAREASSGGYRYTFGSSKSVADAEISLMFTKRNPKGKPAGGSPITLVLQDGKWKVSAVSY